ncbi:MAG: tetratricopeptide repeat protein [Candidatus Pacebacteria bacterium]|nr:tetratricopeptide repeat protein [Candidatus Paceibacterota bacterium]
MKLKSCLLIACLALQSFLFLPRAHADEASEKAVFDYCLPKAEAGDAICQFDIGIIYEFGRGGVTQDYAQAVVWYRKAAEQGNVKAQTNLGAMYRNGNGVPQDYALAVVWYRKAAEQGDSYAQFSLGLSYDNGKGVPQDNAEAVVWYRKAAIQGVAKAQNNLAILYANGEGVPQNWFNAYLIASLAAVSGESNGVKIRDLVAAKLTPAEQAEAQKLSNDWKVGTKLPLR